MEQYTRRVIKSLPFAQSSLLIVDQTASDILAWGCSLEELMDLGVTSVVDLAQLTPATVATAASLAGGRLNRIFIMISTMLHQSEDSIIRACAAGASFCSAVTILTTVSQSAHNEELPSTYSPHCFRDFAFRIQQQLPELQLNIDCQFIPLVVQGLSSWFFLMPGTNSASVGGKPVGYGLKEPTEEDSDSDDEDPTNTTTSQSKQPHKGLTLLAHSLSEAVSMMGFSPEAFCLGPVSCAVGRRLAFIPPPTPLGSDQPPDTRAAIVLIDRALDLPTPSIHGDLLVQRVFDALRDISGSNTNNLTVHVPLDSDSSSSYTLPGSLTHPLVPTTTLGDGESQLAFLLMRQGRDAALFIRKWLREALRKEGLKPEAGKFKPGAVSPEELESLTRVLQSASPECVERHSDLIQLSTAAILALQPKAAEKRDLLAATEKTLLVAASRGADAVVEQLVDLCQAASKNSLISIDDVVQLVLLAYCTIPERQPWFLTGSGGQDATSTSVLTSEQEYTLKEALVTALMNTLKQQESSSVVASIFKLTSESTTTQVAHAVDAMLTEYQELAGFMKHWLIDDCLRGRESEEDIEQGSRRSLTLRLTHAILDQQPLKSLKHIGTSLSGLLKSGLGRIGLSKKPPMPSDFGNTVIIFVIGGVTATEAQEIRAAVEARKAIGSNAGNDDGSGAAPVPDVLVGSTSLLHPHDVLTKIF